MSVAELQIMIAVPTASCSAVKVHAFFSVSAEARLDICIPWAEAFFGSKEYLIDVRSCVAGFLFSALAIAMIRSVSV